MKNDIPNTVPVYAGKLIGCHRASVSNGRLLRCLILLTVVFFCLPTGGNAQKSAPRNASQSSGKLRIWVPSGVIGDRYWIYVDERLKSGPPHGTPANNLNIVSLPGGGWEAWAAEGQILSSRQYDRILKSYLSSGDKYNIFRTVEYAVAPGKYTVEMIISLQTGKSASLAPLPFVASQKYEATVRSGQTADVYPEIPNDWNNNMPPLPTPGRAGGGGGLCAGSSFDLNQTKENIIRWGNSYKNDSLIKILHAAKVNFTSGSKVVILNIPGSSREFDGGQIERIIDEIAGRFSGRFALSEIDECKARFPQYSNSLAASAQVIKLIEDDIDSFRKLAAELKSNQ